MRGDQSDDKHGGGTLPRSLVAALLLTVLALLAAPVALGFGPSENPRAVERCTANVEKQTAKGTTSGGGPKSGIPAPTNCDHFFQGEGLIGNGLPG
jgi:hypothetical protein